MVKTQKILRIHPHYPTKLADIPWPTELQVHGTLRCDGLGVSIVGSRAASGRAMKAAYDLAHTLASHGHRVISGGALGIDSCAHRGAVEAGGYTLSVMACGLDQYYPRRNQRLFEAIVQSRGAIISPFPEGTKPVGSRFVTRNEVIAALADLVVVVEASTRSGSLHTARYATRLGRPLAAFPGSPGCEALLSQGVARVENSQQVLDLLAGKRRTQQVVLPPAGSPEARVLACLHSETCLSASAVAEALDMPLRQAQHILFKLELASLALLQPGQRYLRSRLAM